MKYVTFSDFYCLLIYLMFYVSLSDMFTRFKSQVPNQRQLDVKIINCNIYALEVLYRIVLCTAHSIIKTTVIVLEKAIVCMLSCNLINIYQRIYTVYIHKEFCGRRSRTRAFY